MNQGGSLPLSMSKLSTTIFFSGVEIASSRYTWSMEEKMEGHSGLLEVVHNTNCNLSLPFRSCGEGLLLEGNVFTQGSRQMSMWVPVHMDSFAIIVQYFVHRGQVNLTFLLTSSAGIELVIYILLWHLITMVQNSPFLFHLFSHSHISLFPSPPPLSLMHLIYILLCSGKIYSVILSILLNWHK